MFLKGRIELVVSGDLQSTLKKKKEIVLSSGTRHVLSYKEVAKKG